MDRTNTFDVRTIWDPIVFKCTMQVSYNRGLYLTCVIHVNTMGSHIVRTTKALVLSKAGLKMAA